MSQVISREQMARLVAGAPGMDAARARWLQDGSAVLRVRPTGDSAGNALDFATGPAPEGEPPMRVGVSMSAAELTKRLAGGATGEQESPEPSVLDQVAARLLGAPQVATAAPPSEEAPTMLDRVVEQMGLRPLAQTAPAPTASPAPPEPVQSFESIVAGHLTERRAAASSKATEAPTPAPSSSCPRPRGKSVLETVAEIQAWLERPREGAPA